jgi:hypothetical protein
MNLADLLDLRMGLVDALLAAGHCRRFIHKDNVYIRFYYSIIYTHTCMNIADLLDLRMGLVDALLAAGHCG